MLIFLKEVKQLHPCSTFEARLLSVKNLPYRL